MSGIAAKIPTIKAMSPRITTKIERRLHKNKLNIKNLKNFKLLLYYEFTLM